MEKLLVSSWQNVQFLPESYVFPPEERPGKSIIPLCKSIPVIDLGGAVGNNQGEIIQQILQASHEFGFFQVLFTTFSLFCLVFIDCVGCVCVWRKGLGFQVGTIFFTSLLMLLDPARSNCMYNIHLNLPKEMNIKIICDSTTASSSK